MIGVYKITNTKRGRVYIGSSADTHGRWAQHVTNLRGNNHQNRILQNDWNILGASAFTFEVVEIVEDPADLKDVEQVWLDKYYGKNCYNVASRSVTYKRVMKFTKEGE